MSWFGPARKIMNLPDVTHSCFPHHSQTINPGGFLDSRTKTLEENTISHELEVKGFLSRVMVSADL